MYTSFRFRSVLGGICVAHDFALLWPRSNDRRRGVVPNEQDRHLEGQQPSGEQGCQLTHDSDSHHDNSSRNAAGTPAPALALSERAHADEASCPALLLQLHATLRRSLKPVEPA
ncbi:protein of unknown function [Aminobacter niigataensis]|nr:protein of unknown function [Aminobacter niigataensis]